jgi:serine protease
MSDIADAIVWASGGGVSGVPANGTPARVINLSLGGAGACGPTYAAAVQAARSRGAVVIAAAGNDNTDASNTTPANCPGVLAIASVGNTGAKAADSNFGPRISLAAPGVGITSTSNTGVTTPATDTYVSMSGTSMATPHAAGVAALMLSANSSLRVDDVEWKLIHSTRAFPVACSGCGAGLLDASNAVNSVIGYSPAPVPLLAVSLVSDDGNGNATWQIANPRNAPVILSDVSSVASNASVYITSSSCAVGGWLTAGASCTVATTGYASCSGGTYLLKATNSAGVANGNAWATVPYQSCGG